MLNCSQLQATLQGVKSDNPAQFERVTLCIERCQQLERTGYSVSASKNKHQLLREIQEELKIVSQEEMTKSLSHLPPRPTLLRSHTSVEGGRPQRLSKRRLSTPYISPLTMIGEEDTDIDALSATLPRNLERRPQTLPVRERAMTTGPGVPGVKKTGTSPVPGKKTLFADGIELETVTKVKRSPSPRRSPKPGHSMDGQSSPVRTKSPPRGRAPKLAALGKFGSSGFYADNEDDDDDEPDVKVQQSKVTIRLPGTEELVVPNLGAASAGNSPLQPKKQVANSNQVTIAVEVHTNPDVDETTENSLTTKVTFSDDRSTSSLLPSPETKRNRKLPSPEAKRNGKLPGSDTKRTRKYPRKGVPSKDDTEKRKDAHETIEDESHELLMSSGDKSLENGTQGAARENIRKGSLSLDRKNISGFKELTSAFKESSKFMYHSLEDATMDYSQC